VNPVEAYRLPFNYERFPSKTLGCVFRKHDSWRDKAV